MYILNAMFKIFTSFKLVHWLFKGIIFNVAPCSLAFPGAVESRRFHGKSLASDYGYEF